MPPPLFTMWDLPGLWNLAILLVPPLCTLRLGTAKSPSTTRLASQLLVYCNKLFREGSLALFQTAQYRLVLYLVLIIPF